MKIARSNFSCWAVDLLVHSQYLFHTLSLSLHTHTHTQHTHTHAHCFYIYIYTYTYIRSQKCILYSFFFLSNTSYSYICVCVCVCVCIYIYIYIYIYISTFCFILIALTIIKVSKIEILQVNDKETDKSNINATLIVLGSLNKRKWLLMLRYYEKEKKAIKKLLQFFCASLFCLPSFQSITNTPPSTLKSVS